MRKYFSFPTLCKAVILIILMSAVAALIAAPDPAAESLRLGFPSPILTIHMGKAVSPAVHVSLSGLALDLLLAYALCWAVSRIRK